MEVLTVFLVLGRWRLNDWKFRPPWLHGSQPNWGLNLGPDMLDRLSTLNFFLNLHFIYWGGAHMACVLGEVRGQFAGWFQGLNSCHQAGQQVSLSIEPSHQPIHRAFLFLFFAGAGGG